MSAIRIHLRNNGLSLAFGALFLLSLAGQAWSGLVDFNNQELARGTPPVGLLDYLTSSSFAVDVAENWQSEYLQFFLYVFATVWLVQRGSPESKPMRKVGLESDQEQLLDGHLRDGSPRWAQAGGWRTAVFSRSLGLVMGAIFLLSWLAQSVAGVSAYNAQQLSDFGDPVSWGEYLLSADFWNRTLQNWQSEFLAIGCMAIFSVYLRQRGSPESKPVGAEHHITDETG
ncbi:DUF6766 family protein [Amycolatopsis sp. FDAARGOS 1241]|uniref:DUF6766 family protein n=1 Tax=Amycolatopsis sp. FDAARGOS 1241 TaxID=2778070 RepID=UPI001950C70F|nr:DUF6766 family protein [Amycolatopsis sp. FDAARGOS 1241]QRP48432.1 hypothetical protein I6J71_11585 [Amycolatopsis sp. FDAARGOS 1241]